MQSRLPVELRLEGVTSIEQANAFLPAFIANYSLLFAIDYHTLPSVFEDSPPLVTIDLTLAVIFTRTVDGGSAIRLDNRFYRTINRSGIHVSLRSGSKGLVICTFNNDLFFSCNDTLYALELIPTHEHISRYFDPLPTPDIPKKPHIPPLSHPWKRAYFEAFLSRRPPSASQ